MLKEKELLEKSLYLKTKNCDCIEITNKYNTIEDFIGEIDSKDGYAVDILMLDDEIIEIRLDGEGLEDSKFQTVSDLYEYLIVVLVNSLKPYNLQKGYKLIY